MKRRVLCVLLVFFLLSSLFAGGTMEALDFSDRSHIALIVDEKTEKPKEPSTYSTSNPELTENPNTITPGCNGSDKLCKSDTRVKSCSDPVHKKCSYSANT